jgi:hypothetical protein
LQPIEYHPFEAIMEEVNPDSITPLTDQQEVVLSVLSIISGVLSILGSSTIVFKVVNSFNKSAPYDRLLLGLSCCDILASVTYAINPFLLNSETSQRVWAFGNDTTTTMLGFLAQFSFAAIWYNGMLSYYYLLTVKYGVKRKDFAKKYERYMHFGTWGFFLITATIGAFMGFYGELEIGQGAWIVNWPEGCEATESCKSQFIGLAFGGVPTFFTFISLIVNNLRIYYHVRKQLSPENDRDQTTGAAKQQGDAVCDLTDMSSTSSKNGGDWSTREPPKASSSHSLGSIALSTANQRSSTHSVHIREVVMQGFLYVASFALAYTAAITLRVLEGMDYTAKDEGRIYWLLVLDAFLKPLQGFLNLFVYCRPNYVRFRANYPELGRLWAIRKACLDPNIPRMPKGGSGESGWNTTVASRVAGNKELPDGVPLRKIMTRSMKVANHSSDLAVLKEESCEEDSEDESSRRSDVEPDYEEDEENEFLETIHHHSAAVIEHTRTDIIQGNDVEGTLQESPATRNPVPVESGSPPKTGDPYVSESTSSQYESGDVGTARVEWGKLKLDESSILEELRKLYGENGAEPSSRTKQKQEDAHPMTKRLTMDGSVKLSPIPIHNRSVRQHGERES